jgi:peptidoglycan-associated lipoprotein
MSSSKSRFGVVLVSSGLFLLGGFSALGCSHEQKAPPVHAAPAPIAQAAPRPPAPEPPAEPPAEAPVAQGGPAIFFDFDSSLLRSDAHSVLQTIAGELKAKSAAALEIEGNCDELGTTEYNMALGEARARSAKTYLEHLGVRNARIKTVSYGSERPKYPGHDDDSRAKNRRDDLIVR